jgi:hypothetical protein
MRSDSQFSGRRRRGPRRDGRRGGSGNNPSTRQPAKPQTFWEKVIAFFTGNGKPATRRAQQPRASERSQASRGDRFDAAPQIARKPEVVEVSSPKLYVGNLSFDATESDLFELFNGVGKVQNAEIVAHKYTQKSKGFAFVTMQNIEEAKRAVGELHDKDFMGRKLVVSGAKTNDMRDAA